MEDLPEINLQKIKQDVIAFVYNVVLLVSAGGALISIGDSISAFIRDDRSKLQGFLLSAIIGIAITIFFGYMRFVILSRSLVIAYRFLSLCMIIIATHLLLTAGSTTVLASLLLVLLITITTIVQGVKESILISVISVSLVLGAFSLHQVGVSVPLPPGSPSSFGTTIMVAAFIAGFYQIAQLGYRQIHASYYRATRYADELDKLNKNLDNQVKLRTKQLQESFERQTESLYTAAAMGRVSRALIHDLATPLSVLNISLDRKLQENTSVDRNEFYKLQRDAMQQMLRILENSRAMMDGKQLNEKFNVNEVLQSVLSLIKHELQRTNIKIIMDIPREASLTGVIAVFERIVMNLLMNAVEELSQIDRPQRWIKVSGQELDAGFILEIIDNGRGIAPENWEQIFDPEYSTKTEGINLGFGLAFVRNSIEKYYQGNITIDSDANTYTKFILRFENQDEGASQSTSVSS